MFHEGSLVASVNSVMAGATERNDVSANVVTALAAIEHMMEVEGSRDAADRTLVVLERK